MVKVIRLSWIFLSFWFTIGRNMNLATSPPPVVPPSSTSRVVAAVATWQFGALAVEACAAKLLQPGASALDAVEAGINVVELDDAEQYYVGLGGLPNAKGVVECDAAVMDHRRRYGAVMGLTDIATPVSVARSILEHSPHSIISGEGAKQWAVSRGFPVTSMLTDKSRDEYVSWLDKQPPIPPVPATATATEQDGVEVSVGTISQHAGTVSGTVGVDVDNTKPADCHDTVGVICLDAEGRLAGTVRGTISADVDDTMPVDCHDTVGVICLDAEGRLACGTSTSGWAYKHPGRVGDSPVVGAGLYCDGRVGAAVATGDGEEILRVCLSHLVVELMRNHMSPQEACREGIARLQALIDEDAVHTFASSVSPTAPPSGPTLCISSTPSSSTSSSSTPPSSSSPSADPPPAQPRMHKQLTVGVIAMSATGEVGAASTLGALNVHRGRPGFPAVCWRQRVGGGASEGSGGCVGGGSSGAGGGCGGSEADVIVSGDSRVESAGDIAATPVPVDGVHSDGAQLEWVKDLTSGGSMYIIQADAEGATF